jgi:hypothetical protein
VFLVNSHDRMKDLINYEGNSIAFVSTNVTCHIYSDSIDAFNAHEFMHIVSINSWGESGSWIKEGLAVYADDHWHGYPLHAFCKHLLEQGKLIPLGNVIESFRTHADGISYPEAGSFVKYLYEVYGSTKFKEIWKQGGSEIPHITGKSLSELELEWIRVIQRADASRVRS